MAAATNVRETASRGNIILCILSPHAMLIVLIHAITSQRHSNVSRIFSRYPDIAPTLRCEILPPKDRTADRTYARNKTLPSTYSAGFPTTSTAEDAPISGSPGCSTICVEFQSKPSEPSELILKWSMNLSYVSRCVASLIKCWNTLKAQP